ILADGFKKLQTFRDRTGKLMAEVKAELERWRKQLDQPATDAEEAARTRVDWQNRVRDLVSLHDDHDTAGRAADRELQALTEKRRPEAWKGLRDRVTDEIAVVARLLVLQTQVRVFLIQLPSVPYEEHGAFQYAIDNRLDLMNERGRVVDTWRQ